MEQSSVMDLFVSAINATGVECVDKKRCSYDPTNPPPTKLTCKDDPCPTGQVIIALNYCN